MKIDAGGYTQTLQEAGAAARRAEAAGFDGWWAVETQVDGFLAATIGAERTDRVDVGTGIVVAFARNPMSVALAGNDVQQLSDGRFVMGLGSQVKGHITKRFSMPWSHPAPRMREFVLAVRAIWRAWETGEKLDFHGDFYSHTLMTPFFDPGPNPHGNPPIFVSAVGPLMTQAAGEVADGLISHGFTTERYLREVTVPALERGLAKRTDGVKTVDISLPLFAVAREADEDISEAMRFVRQQIGFYGSTPTYRPVLDLHGWGALGDELGAMTRRGEWDKLADAIDDEVLHTIAIVGTPEEALAEAHRRYGDIIARLNFPLPPEGGEERWRELLSRSRATA
ncbi:MAG TPA: TIGR03617 family F420-dependent LLM class oxidoreductase [Solirubrobacteraceae bacterium]|jgi:probable F420-dependent oxidoreductase|nr:TIGR03617 family F420-dependent LLM class oxidoreductase [Solirubrobacteraceae bacterium]